MHAYQFSRSPKCSQIPYRCSPNSHYHVGASEAKRSEAVLTFAFLLALIMLDIFLHAFQSCMLSQMFPDTLHMLSKFSFPRGIEQSEAERGHSNLRVFTCFHSVGHCPACFSVVQCVIALPVPMLRQVFVPRLILPPRSCPLAFKTMSQKVLPMDAQKWS